MRIQIEALNSTNPLDLPCIRFEGTVSTNEGYLSASQLRDDFALAAMPFAQALGSLAGEVMHGSRIRDDARGAGWITLPEFVFNVDPTPQAFTLVGDEVGVVYTHCGFFFTLTKLSRTLGWILDRVENSSEISFDEIERMEVPGYVIQEILAVLQMWQEMEVSESFNIERMLGEVEPAAFARMEHLLHKVCHIIFFHESAHWQRTIYRAGVWSDLETRTLNHISRWMSSYDPALLISRESHDAAVNFLSADWAVARSWAEEIQCDLLASSAARAAGGGSAVAARDVYTAQGVLYAFVMQLQEIYDTRVAGREPTHRTHPPADIRGAIVHYIDAMEMGQTVGDYQFKVAGACTYINFCGARILGDVLGRLG
ncbi:MAG TPA: hypothetical protein VN714_34285 [Trebonia sp.]|nr:hypothetical protein [Trebonia sp.]